MLGFKSKKTQSKTVNRVAKELFLDLIDKQLTFQDSMGVIQAMHQTLAKWGGDWLDEKFCTHIKNDLAEQGKLK